MKVDYCYPHDSTEGGRITLVNITHEDAERLKDILLADRDWEYWRELTRALDLIAVAN